MSQIAFGVQLSEAGTLTEEQKRTLDSVITEREGWPRVWRCVEEELVFDGYDEQDELHGMSSQWQG